MDKKLILAVAGSGKTTYIVDSLSTEKRCLIVTYSNNNYDNLKRKILNKFGGDWPNTIYLMTYFRFLYNFCYKPFLSDKYKAKGIVFYKNEKRCNSQDLDYYFTPNRYFYSNRLAFFIEKRGVIEDVKKRLEEYFDVFIIDEVQDFAGRDFNFLEKIMTANLNMLFVGDFYQHTFDTSRDGNVNKSLYTNYSKYCNRFVNNGFIVDQTLLSKSYRCSKSVCDFITSQIGISIDSHNTSITKIEYITDKNTEESIINDDSIIKLHYKNGHIYGNNHKNWGETKGMDCYEDVCIMLYKGIISDFLSNRLSQKEAQIKNKLYVAISRAHRNVFFIKEK